MRRVYESTDSIARGSGIRHIVLSMAILSITHAAWTQDSELTVARLFASPALSGPSVSGLQISPDGTRVTYLQGKASDREQQDLWEYHIGDDARRMLVDSTALVAEEVLSEEERARRERQRLGGVRGIVDYSWSADGNALLIPLGGDLYYYDLRRPPEAATQRLTTTEAFETDARLSPRSNYVSFIRDQDLYVLHVATLAETRLTSDGGGVIRNGMAEFIAQEEMDRDTGYWWSEDEARIAFIRVDETPVDVVRRFDINAETIEVVEQRYPYAGEANVAVRLGVARVGSGSVTWIDLGDDDDFYLPRVKWLPDSRTLSYQWQSRDQRRLELRFVDTVAATQRVVLTERADTWINLHHDLHFPAGGSGFIWTSERSGYRHLYRYDLDGRMTAQLTSGEWVVDALTGIDDAGRIYFTAARESPTEQHLYSLPPGADAAFPPERLTREPGWHAITMNDSANVYLDSHSNTGRPPNVRLHRSDGTAIAYLLENALEAGHPYWPYAGAHAATEFGTLSAGSGETLHYRLLKPADFAAGRRYPVFVSVYGGPLSQMVRNQWGRLFEQYMTRQGFIVFALDNRGSARRGTRFESAIHLQAGAREVEDQLLGIRYLKSLDFVDPDRIGVFGWSYGGYMALMSLFKAQEAFAAAVSVAPVTDWRLYDTHYTERYLGHPADNAAGYAASSVFPWIDALAAPLPPLLVMHGMADDNVLFTNSTKLFKSLQDKGILFDVMTYPGGRHGLSGTVTQTHVYETIAAFFKRHLASG